MEPVIVMIGRANESALDIEIMPDIPVGDLIEAIAQAKKWPGSYDIYVNGQILDHRKSLAELNIWDGAYLVMLASNRPSIPRSNQQALPPIKSLNTKEAPNVSSPANPLSGLRPLKKLGEPVGNETDSAAQKPASPVANWRTTPPDPKSAQKTEKPD